MTWWDNEFAARLDEMAIILKMNKQNVDDINMTSAVPAITPCNDAEG